MADISRELNDIEYGRWGWEIRMPIHDALKKIADETPDVDPQNLGPCYMVSCDGEFATTNIEDDFIVAPGRDWAYIVDSFESLMTSSVEDDYVIVLK